MIELKNLAKRIENQLNGLGGAFKIYADMGDYKCAYRQGNDITRYINGVLEPLSPSLLPMKNLEIFTQTIRISFLLDIDLLNKDADGNYIEVTNIRKLLERYISTYNAQSYVYTEDGKNYEITPAYSGILVGTASQLSPIGDVLPIYLDGTYTIIERGINANSISLILNGEDLFVEDGGITRSRVAESNMFSDGDDTKSVVLSNGISIDFNLPLIDTAECLKIEQDILKGKMNKAQCFQYKRGSIEQNFICVFGTNSESFSIGKNVGLKIALIEGRQDLLDYDERWSQTTMNVRAGETIDLGAETNDFYGVVFWGDGESETSTTGEFQHTYSEAGTYTIRTFVK